MKSVVQQAYGVDVNVKRQLMRKQSASQHKHTQANIESSSDFTPSAAQSHYLTNYNSVKPKQTRDLHDRSSHHKKHLDSKQGKTSGRASSNSR